MTLHRRKGLRRDTEGARRFIENGRRRSAESLRSSSLLSRTDGPKPPVPPRRRDWAAARAKVEDEGRCRIDSLSCDGPVEAAHVIGRAHDRRVHLPGKPEAWWFEVDADSIAPLCSEHHRRYDAHRLDLLPYLTLQEQERAVRDAGGIERARIRTAPSLYRVEQVEEAGL